jgi:hypothetical protein
MVGVAGIVFTVTVVAVELSVQLGSLIATVYAPAVVAVMLLVVAALLHTYV